MNQLYHRICYNCGVEFETPDEEGFYCEECWKELLQEFFQKFKKNFRN